MSSVVALSGISTPSVRAEERCHQKPGQLKGCYARLVCILILYSKNTRWGGKQAGRHDFTEVCLAVSRLLRAVTHCFGPLSRPFCSRQQVTSCLAFRQCKQCWEQVTRQTNKALSNNWTVLSFLLQQLTEGTAWYTEGSVTGPESHGECVVGPGLGLGPPCLLHHVPLLLIVMCFGLCLSSVFCGQYINLMCSVEFL